MELTVYPLGDKAITLSFGETISEEINQMIRRFVFILEKSKKQGIVEWVPAYTSLTVYYMPELFSYSEIKMYLLRLLDELESVTLPAPSIYEIPTLYGGEAGPDLNFVAAHNKLKPEDVITLHTSRTYLIYMMGFSPGFPYLGGMSEKIAAPRLNSPRLRIPAGSVGIAGNQTGIYSLNTPGGWRIIGKTPLQLFKPDHNVPFLLEAGQYVRFVPISKPEYDLIEQAVKQGEYTINFYSKKG